MPRHLTADRCCGQLSALSTHPESVAVQAQGCAALWNLVSGNAASKAAARQQGAVALLQAARGGFAQHAAVLQCAEGALRALSNG